MHADRLLGDAVAERIATALAADLLARRQAATPPTVSAGSRFRIVSAQVKVRGRLA